MTFLLVISCNNDDALIDNDIVNNDFVIDDVVSNDVANNDILVDEVATVKLPKRPGSLPETTTAIPHVQIGVELIPEVNEELFRRVYSIPGIENRPSVIGGWRGLWLTDEVTVLVPEAVISGREFAHIHDDGSLHIFLEPARANEAVKTCWAILHPFVVQGRRGWDGFVMLYTPQSFNELDVTFQLIVDGYNYVTGQNLSATDYY